MSLAELVAVSEAVRSTSKRGEKVGIISDYLASLADPHLRLAVQYLAGRVPQRAIGVGWSALSAVPTPAPTSSLDLIELDRRLHAISEMGGDGSHGSRDRALAELYRSITQAEQDFLTGLLLDNLRQGALEGVMVEAIARAFAVPAAVVRRALMLSGDLGGVAVDARRGGRAALADYRLTLFRPVLPMLAKTAPSAGEAVDDLNQVVVDVKLDGVRVQVHGSEGDVRVYTRTLRQIDAPHVVAASRRIEAKEFVLDGEAVGIDEAGTPLAFPETMGHLETGGTASRPHLSVRFFDVLFVDGTELLETSTAERMQMLDRVVPAELRVDRIETADPEAADAFFDTAVAGGAEGVMVKDSAAPYAAGRRGAAWRKVKPVHTLDLVVLAVEWGSGRRRGTLSNIHLGARDGDDFVMLGKTFKGMTDEMLAWQTERFLELETGRQRHIVYVRPEQVVEIAFDGVLPSPRYPGGVSLRFARVKRYRHDKTAAEADTLDTVRSYLV